MPSLAEVIQFFSSEILIQLNSIPFIYLKRKIIFYPSLGLFDCYFQTHLTVL